MAGPALTIADGPACGGGFKPPFDVEGAPKGRTPVVDAGRFVEPLSDLAWAGRMGLTASSGNAARRDTLGRIVPNDVTVAPSCICIEPGASSLADLFARMGDGMYLTDIGDIYHSFNFASGDVSAPCRGVWVRGGEPAGGIRACTLSDNLASILANVATVSDELEFVDLEDLNAYYAGAPDVLVDGLNLVGTGE